MTMLDAALQYYDKYQFSIIPMEYIPPANGEPKGTKKPRIPWKEYQNKLPARDEIIKWWKQWPNAMIGVVAGKVSGICTIDVDEEIGFKKINELIPDSLIVPTYKTPSGGVQMVFEYPDFNLRVAVRNVEGCDLRAEGGIAILPPSKNAAGCYKWMDSISINDVCPPPLPAAYLNYIKQYNKKNNKDDSYRDVTQNGYSQVTDKQQQSQQVTISLTEGSRNDSLFTIVLSLAKGNMTKENARYVIKNINVNPLLSEKEIETILESAYSRHFGRTRNIHQEIEAWGRVTRGHFHVTNAYNELQIVTKEEKAAARMAFSRLSKKDGIFDKVGDKDGFYMLRDVPYDDSEEEDDIDWENADSTLYDVKWPLGIHEYVKLYRRSIVIVAGESNAGKTAFCLNVARKNRDHHDDIRYLISEGDPAELKERVLNFGEEKEKWRPVRFKQLKGNNLKRLIKPDGFNIIDYLELHKDFYEVSGIINDVYELLTTGIAVIAMQKPEGRDLAIGGRGTLDKSRLYLAIEPGKLKIVKGKLWRNPLVNPNKLYTNFKLVAGCKFIGDDRWIKDVK